MSFNHGLKTGDTINNDVLKGIFKCSPQGGLCEASHKPPYAKKVIMRSNQLNCG